mgnify:CR=1 FL=1|tara:strand:- start:378 stop:1274 length:897 start_codon:yes stop_codon:yes gene_type:complete
MARNATPISTDWDYNVVMEDLFTADGKKSGFKCTRRTDTGKVLNPVTKDYGIVQNSDLFPRVRDAFQSHGWGENDYSEDIYVARDGRRVYGRYDFKNEVIKLPQVGDELGLRLTVNNSFDRTCKVSFSVGMLRLVCTNGMTTLEKEFSMQRKHSNKLDLNFIQDALENAVNAWDSLKKDNNPFSRMADAKISQEEGLNILLNMTGNTGKKPLSEVQREAIAQIWNGPTYKEDEQRNVWNLLNASTQYLSNDTDVNRFEMVERVTASVTSRLMDATRNQGVLAKLKEAPEVEGVVVANN